MRRRLQIFPRLDDSLFSPGKRSILSAVTDRFVSCECSEAIPLNKSCCRPRHCGLPGARQADCEFGELAGDAVDLDRAAMLLGDDVIADR